jgi:two-component system sensor histidine kinase AlgZ
VSLRVPRRALPQFCSSAELLALLVVALLVAVVMQLAPGADAHLRVWSLALLFAAWLATLLGVVLCKSRRLLQLLPGAWPWAGAWLLAVLLALLAATVVWWLDHALGTRLAATDGPRFVFGSGTATALVGAALLRYLWVLGEWRERRDALARAQLDALQARIRPHFLFNSLNTALALVPIDPAAAARTLENLSDLFRAALNDSDAGTLGEELDLVDGYLAIEQLRLGERLRIARDWDDLPRDLPLPRLLLQPLVENAIVHGIAARADGGTLQLRGRRHDGALDIEIINPLPERPARAGTGHGLANVRARIGYHFGARARLQAGAVGAHWHLTLRLPDAHPDRR